MDVKRAFAWLHTGGTDGASAHLVADVVRGLMERGHTIKVVTLAMRPFKLVLHVDGEVVSVREGPREDNGTREAWFWATRGNASVRFNPLRAMDVPSTFADATTGEDVVVEMTNWMEQWPTPLTNSAAALASAVAGKPVHVKTSAPCAYLSETLFCEAIEMLFSAVRV